MKRQECVIFNESSWTNHATLEIKPAYSSYKTAFADLPSYNANYDLMKPSLRGAYATKQSNLRLPRSFHSLAMTKNLHI